MALKDFLPNELDCRGCCCGSGGTAEAECVRSSALRMICEASRSSCFFVSELVLERRLGTAGRSEVVGGDVPLRSELDDLEYGRPPPKGECVDGADDKDW